MDCFLIKNLRLRERKSRYPQLREAAAESTRGSLFSSALLTHEATCVDAVMQDRIRHWAK